MGLRGLHVNERNFLNRIDVRLILLIFCLNVIGLFNLFSATHGPNSTGVETLFIQQLVYPILKSHFLPVVYKNKYQPEPHQY